MNEMRPNGQRAHIAVILLWIVISLEIVSLVSYYFQYDLLKRAVSGGMTMEEANANDLRVRIIAIFEICAYLVSGITFIMWFRRAYFNLHERAEILSYTEGWAAGAWFVPFVNFYRPYQIMKELYQETHSLFVKNGKEADSISDTTVLSWWWTLWIVCNLSGNFVFRYGNSAKTMDELNNSTVFCMIDNLFGIVGALLAIKVVRDYAKVEQQFAELGDVEPMAMEDDVELLPQVE